MILIVPDYIKDINAIAKWSFARLPVYGVMSRIRCV